MSDTPSITDEQRTKLVTAMQVARIYFQNNLKDPVAQAYVQKRGLSKKDIFNFQIGFAPDTWEGLAKHYSHISVKEAAHEAGLLRQRETTGSFDIFRGRLMFPIKDLAGDVVGFGGRQLEAKEDSPKYINTSETPLFKKGELLYGLFENQKEIAAGKEAVIVEGYLDVIAMHGAGVRTGLAPMGTALTPQQLKLITDLGVERVVFCFDGDSAGQKAAARTLETVMQHHVAGHGDGLEFRFLLLPDNHDPDSFIRQHGVDQFEALKGEAQGLAEFIHRTCTRGLMWPKYVSKDGTPALEDQAAYLTNLRAFTDQAGPLLYAQLLIQAWKFAPGAKPESAAKMVPPPDELRDLPFAQYETYIELKNAQKAPGADRELLEVRIQSIAKNTRAAPDWDPSTALAARWVIHDRQLQGAIAQKLAGIAVKALGIPELVSIAKTILEKGTPTGALFEFASAHGALSPTEIKELRTNWDSWMRRAIIQQSADVLHANPESQNARQTIKAALGY